MDFLIYMDKSKLSPCFSHSWGFPRVVFLFICLPISAMLTWNSQSPYLHLLKISEIIGGCHHISLGVGFQTEEIVKGYLQGMT